MFTFNTRYLKSHDICLILLLFYCILYIYILCITQVQYALYSVARLQGLMRGPPRGWSSSGGRLFGEAKD